MALITIRRDGPVTLLGLDRPDKLNALDQALCDEVTAALAEIANEPSILVIHSTTPGMFVAGADIAELLERDAEIGMRGVNAILFERLEERRWPTIAAIDGAALGGGCELALACDLRVASERSSSASPSSAWASSPARAATGGWPRRSACRWPVGCSTPARSSARLRPTRPAWSTLSCRPTT